MSTPGEVSLELINYIGERIKSEAHAAAESAAYNGSFGDNGAGALTHTLRIYYLGFRRELPEEWKKYEQDYLHSKDPDYRRYLELKRKFEGK